MTDSGQRYLRAADAEKQNMGRPSAAMWSLARDEEANAAAAKAYSRPAGTVEDLFVKPEDVAAARSATDEEEESHEQKKGVARKVKEKAGSVKDSVIGHCDPTSKAKCMGAVKNLISGLKPKNDNYEEGDMMVSAPLGRPGGTPDYHRERGLVDTWSTDSEGAVHGGRRVGGDRRESN